MGYQESFIGGSPDKFNELLKIISENGEDYYRNVGVCIPFVVTLNKASFLLGEVGNKFFYVCGERYPQSHLDEFLNEKKCNGIQIVFCEDLPENVQKKWLQRRRYLFGYENRIFHR